MYWSKYIKFEIPVCEIIILQSSAQIPTEVEVTQEEFAATGEVKLIWLQVWALLCAEDAS